MTEVGTMITFFAFVTLLAFVLTKVGNRVQSSAYTPVDFPDGTTIKILTPTGGYRSTLVRQSEQGLVVSSPLYDNRYIPLRVDDFVVVQIPSFGGLVTFRSQIIDRNSMTHEFLLEQPLRIRKTNRRCEDRIKSVAGRAVKINGQFGEMEDLSASGMRVRTSERVVPGDLVTIELIDQNELTTGYALESRTAAIDGQLGREVRIRFVEPLAGLIAPRGSYSRQYLRTPER